jgi:predicted MFS family arabinose efflux permease
MDRPGRAPSWIANARESAPSPASALKRCIFLLSLAAFASAASLRVTDALLPRLADEFSLGIAAASRVITGFAVAYGLMQVLFGPLGDRFGKLRVIALAGSAAALASLACFAAPGFHGLVLARVVAGAFCACIIPLAMAWIGDVVPYEERQPVLARFLLGQILGLAAGAAMGGFAAQTQNWRWPFAFLAAWLAIACALLARQSRSDPAPHGAAGHFFHDLARVAKVRWARVVIATVFVEGVVVFGALAFIPTHLHFVRHVELARAGLAIVAFAAGGAAFAFTARAAVRRLGEAGLAVGGTAVLSCGFLVVATASRQGMIALGCFAAGLGFYMLHNTLQTNATQMSPQRRGAAMALFASMLFIGQSAGVALCGALVERFGTTPVMIAMAAAIVPVGCTFAWLRRTRAG